MIVHIQTSFNNSNKTTGTLFLVPTPIGNLQDITLRCIDTLRTVDYIASEDTRHTMKLCNHFEIKTPLFSYHRHNEVTKVDYIIDLLLKGSNVALVSDAGTPVISDPGEVLVKSSLANNISVVSLPGANAAITALVASGLQTTHFCFGGFLSRNHVKQKKALTTMAKASTTIIIYEAPHRIKKTLKNIYEIFGDCSIVIGRELSKKFETYIRGQLSAISEWLHANSLQGEIVLVISANTQEESPSNDNNKSTPEDLTTYSISDHVNYYINSKNLTTTEAIKCVSKVRKLTRQDVYRLFHRK